MKFTKELSYKLAKPIIIPAIADTTLFAGCNNNDLKGKRTVYKFNLINIEPIVNWEQIAASADSVEVVEIIFEPDKNLPWGGVNMQKFYDVSVTPAFQAAGKKAKGNGIYKKIDDEPEDHAIEPKYKELGFNGFTYQKVDRRKNPSDGIFVRMCP